MADHADTIRETLDQALLIDAGYHEYVDVDGSDALAALDALVAERDRLVALLRKSEDALDETLGWINTDYIGCVDVQDRAEQTLRDVRNELAAL